MDPLTEKPPQAENEKMIEHAWLFDVDGVLTHPEQKQVTEPKLFDEITKRLRKGEPVALVTGRSLSWLAGRVIGPLEQRIKERSLLSNFFAVGEKGGVWITYSQEGEAQEHVDESIEIPQYLQHKVREFVKREFSDLMFYDGSKKTMISVEMKDGIKLEDYHQRQAVLNEELKNLIKKHGLSHQLEIDSTTIATDIQDKHAGKDFAARRVLEWLKSRNVVPKVVVAIGDSQSDLEMAEEICRNNLPVEFVYVGKPERLQAADSPFTVVSTKSQFEKGTLEYLQSSK